MVTVGETQPASISPSTGIPIIPQSLVRRMFLVPSRIVEAVHYAFRRLRGPAELRPCNGTHSPATRSLLAVALIWRRVACQRSSRPGCGSLARGPHLQPNEALGATPVDVEDRRRAARLLQGGQDLTDAPNPELVHLDDTVGCEVKRSTRARRTQLLPTAARSATPVQPRNLTSRNRRVRSDLSGIRVTPRQPWFPPSPR